MIEIKDLLLSFNNLLLSEEIKKESIRFAISEAIHLEIKKEDVAIRKNVVFLNIKPIYKNEIFMKKEEIMSRLEKSLGKRSPQNIR